MEIAIAVGSRALDRGDLKWREIIHEQENK